ncbi:MAG: hypothetical protein RR458_00540 [Clostridia bacterium]
MEKNLKKVIAIVLVVIALISCVACGSSDKPQTLDVGYSKAEQSVESRMSRVIDDYVVERYGVKQTYTVKDFKEHSENSLLYNYTFKIILKYPDPNGDLKMYEISCGTDYHATRVIDYKMDLIE